MPYFEDDHVFSDEIFPAIGAQPPTTSIPLGNVQQLYGRVQSSYDQRNWNVISVWARQGLHQLSHCTTEELHDQPAYLTYFTFMLLRALFVELVVPNNQPRRTDDDLHEPELRRTAWKEMEPLAHVLDLPDQVLKSAIESPAENTRILERLRSLCAELRAEFGDTLGEQSS